MLHPCMHSSLLRFACLFPFVLGAAESSAPEITARDFQMLVPGFEVREAPVGLTSLNNIEYAPDGRLFAGGYDGRFHLLRDTDGDGIEDSVTTFSPETTPNYPLGMAVRNGEPYAVLTDEVVRWRDTNGDGVPDRRETVVKGFDDPELTQVPYLNHRRVDSSMAIAFGPDGALYVTMGNAGYNNAYWKDKAGVSHYATSKRRGCLLRFGADGHVENLASGLRYIMCLQFNRHGDLFGTDQEGATWVPNGNPFDELLHIQTGRHYGFPPAHPVELPGVVDEPSVYDYAPQHQSTCGFRFNTPGEGRGLFGPAFWVDDALVTGESRGRLWRTKTVKTAAGYVARSELIARVPLLLVDCAVSPRGDLVVCAHSGKPDWGNGPNGRGHLFHIRLRDAAAPQPVFAYAAGPATTAVVFDRPLPSGWTDGLLARSTMTAGRHVSAADRLESMRPSYAVVEMQQREQPVRVELRQARLDPRRTVLWLEGAERTNALKYALALPGSDPSTSMDLAFDLTGVQAEWQGAGATWSGWIPHADLTAARGLTLGSATHQELWERLNTKGRLTLRGQLDLWRLLIPATQPGSELGHTPAPETVTVRFRGDSRLDGQIGGAAVQRVGDTEVQFTRTSAGENRWIPFELTVETPSRALDIRFSTPRDTHLRALPPHRFLLPFATPPLPMNSRRTVPEIAGGNWKAGRDLFLGKATCATCHRLRGDGFRVGPDLDNLVHRDYAGVWKDIVDPGATLNPDALAYRVRMQDGAELTGTRLAETPEQLQLAQAGGVVHALARKQIQSVEPLPQSLMPAGLEKNLNANEVRDLMTYLLLNHE